MLFTTTTPLVARVLFTLRRVEFEREIQIEMICVLHFEIFFVQCNANNVAMLFMVFREHRYQGC